MSTLSAWWQAFRARPTIVHSLARIEGKVDGLMAGLDDIRDNQAKEKALIEKLLGLVKSVPAGTFTADQQAEIDAIVADQAATLAEDTTAAADTTQG